jgi:hypothetical protein
MRHDGRNGDIPPDWVGQGGSDSKAEPHASSGLPRLESRARSFRCKGGPRESARHLVAGSPDARASTHADTLRETIAMKSIAVVVATGLVVAVAVTPKSIEAGPRQEYDVPGTPGGGAGDDDQPHLGMPSGGGDVHSFSTEDRPREHLGTSTTPPASPTPRLQEASCDRRRDDRAVAARPAREPTARSRGARWLESRSCATRLLAGLVAWQRH